MAADVQQLTDRNATFRQFFGTATLNPNPSLIKGSICGDRIEEVVTPLTRQARFPGKLMDELTNERKMEGTPVVVSAVRSSTIHYNTTASTGAQSLRIFKAAVP